MLKQSSDVQNWPCFVLAAYGLSLVTATHWPAASLPQVFNMHDKFLHFSCYAGLGLLAYWALSAGGWLGITVRSIVIIIVATSVFGAVDEATQYFAPGRVVDRFDWVANTLGGAMGVTFYHQFARWIPIQKLGVGGR